MLVVKCCMIVTASDDLSDLLARNIEAVTSVRLTRYVIIVIVVAVTDGISKRNCGHTIILRMSSVCSSSERTYDKFCEYLNF